MNLQLEIIIIGVLVAVTCALPGAFLLLRNMSMVSDAISHSILPGIVVGYFIAGVPNSPLMIVFATLTGLITVVLTELITNTRMVKEDAAIGLVYPFLFSIGLLLIAKYAYNIHLDTDSVLLGEIAFAPFDRLTVGNLDLGPKSIWILSAMLFLNVVFIVTFYKELQLSTFDSNFAALQGFRPLLINYILMILVSATIVTAFEAVGVILVIALMIVPGATAYIMTVKLKSMLVLTILISFIMALGGYGIARSLDTSISGIMATLSGVIFFLVYLFYPETGILAVKRRLARQRIEFAQMTLVIHIANHTGTPTEMVEREQHHLIIHLGWEDHFARKILSKSLSDGILVIENGLITLTERGKKFAEAAILMVNSRYHPDFEALRNHFIIFHDQ